jgi:hypothetical protein
MNGRSFALALFMAASLQVSFSRAANATDEFQSFRRCVDQNVKSVFRNSLKTGGELALYGYHTDAANELISICDPTLSPETVQDGAYTTNVEYKYINNALEVQADAAIRDKVQTDLKKQRRQAELDAPRIKAAKDAESDAGSAYYRCLVNHAKILALNSNEPAETIAKASFPSCSVEREAIFNAYHQHGDMFAPEAMDVAEKRLEQGLLLEIIKARAVRPTPTPSPTKSDSPI